LVFFFGPSQFTNMRGRSFVFVCYFFICSLYSYAPRVWLFLVVICHSQFILIWGKSVVFLVIFTIRSLYCCRPRVLFLVFFMNSLGSYFRACLSSCLHGKWRFKNLSFIGPCWKSYTFSEVYNASAESMSSCRSSTSQTVRG